MPFFGIGSKLRRSDESVCSFVRRYYTPYPEPPDQELVNELVSQYSVDAMVVDRGSSLPEILRNAGLREVKSVNQFRFR